MKKKRSGRPRRPLFPCPKCGQRTKVDESVRKEGMSYPQRDRRCLKCRFAFKTREIILETE